MRALFLILVPLLSGCAGDKSTGPGTIPPDAIGAVYTDKPTEQLASCFAKAIGGTVEIRGARFLISSPSARGTSYDVGTSMAGGAYPTELIVRGVHNPIEEQRGGVCFSARSTLG